MLITLIRSLEIFMLSRQPWQTQISVVFPLSSPPGYVVVSSNSYFHGLSLQSQHSFELIVTLRILEPLLGLFKPHTTVDGEALREASLPSMVDLRDPDFQFRRRHGCLNSWTLIFTACEA